MIEDQDLLKIKEQIAGVTAQSRHLLDEAVRECRTLQCAVIKPRGVTHISLVASDGGHNRVEFNPFELQVVRVVDSYGKNLFFDVVSPGSDVDALGAKHLDEGTALGELMTALDVGSLRELSPMFDPRRQGGWMMDYREICEWAALWRLLNREYGSSTLILRDGLLRSKIFRDDLFIRMYHLIKNRIEEVAKEEKRKIWIAGLAKTSEVHRRYGLAMSIAGAMATGSPMYAAIPMSMQEKVYKWREYIQSPTATGQGEQPKFNMGAMHFVRFGNSEGDPVWTVDILEFQKSSSQEIFGSMLADAIDGFPVPFYPKSLQNADNQAQVTDLDLDVLRDELFDSVRSVVGNEHVDTLEGHRLSVDFAQRRYG